MACRPAPDEIDEEPTSMHGSSSAYTSVRIARSRAELIAAARLRNAESGESGEHEVVDLELDEYDARATHVLAVEDGRLAATIRLLPVDAGDELPLDGAFGLTREGDRRVAELSRPSVRADRQGDSAVVMGLLRAAYDEALAAGVDEIYLVADQPLLTLLRGHGFRFRAVAGPMWANASWSIAAVLAVDEILPGLRLHQAVHGCRVGDFFARHFDGDVPGHEICDRQAG
jgi:N-acyl-L-homoserine lactone synthetase